MSFDLHLKNEHGGEVELSPGPTYNLSPMFALALGYGFRELDGKKAGEAALDCALAHDRMRDDPEPYKALNPDNGWGDYDGALWVLQTLAEECARFPDMTVVVT